MKKKQKEKIWDIILKISSVYFRLAIFNILFPMFINEIDAGLTGNIILGSLYLTGLIFAIEPFKKELFGGFK